jgi:hypothetical protein
MTVTIMTVTLSPAEHIYVARQHIRAGAISQRRLPEPDSVHKK